MELRRALRGRAVLLLVGMTALSAACASSPTGARDSTVTTEAITTEAVATPTPSPAHAGPDRSGATATESPVTTTATTSRCLGDGTLIESIRWTEVDGRAVLAVVPADLLRACGPTGVADRAWAQVLARQPGADTPGMAEQFTCHVLFAPGKQEWRLEPWRPVVDGAEMIRARCNPGTPGG